MIQFLKLVGIIGVPYGVVMVVFRSFGEHNDPLFFGLFQALFFGVFMAAWATWWTRRNRLRLEATGITVGSMHPRQERQLQMSMPPSTAFEVCVRVLAGIPKARVVAADSATCTASVRIGMTWRSFGEHMTVRVAPEGAGSNVTITSTPFLPTTLIDGGKGAENVETFLRRLSAA